MGGESSGKDSGKRKLKVGLLYDARMCKHDTPDGEDHPECPNRIKVIWEKLQVTGLAERCVVLGGSKAEDKHLQLVHTKDHVNLVKSLSTKKKDSKRNKIASKLDSIYLNGGSSEAAYLAAGSVVEVAEKVAKGELDRGFAIVRPPGHHAEADEAMGFCLFNNPDLGIKKILIVDWDVHHGNGTQKMFWKDPRVLVFSVHRHDDGKFYPEGDDGDYDKVGEGPGEGFNINVPWEKGRCRDADYLAVWSHILIPVTKEFKPDIVLLSAGFDAAKGDPLGGCLVTPYGYSVMLKKLMEFAQGRIVMALEGGYNHDSVAKCSLVCVQVLLEDKPIQGPSSQEYPFLSTYHLTEAVRERLCTYWPSLAGELSSELITPASTKWNSEINHEIMDQMYNPVTVNPHATSIMPRLESLLGEGCMFTKPLCIDNENTQRCLRDMKRYNLESMIHTTTMHIGLVRYRQQAERLRASLEVALEEKEALQAKVTELQGEESDKLRLRVSRDKYKTEAKEAAENLTQVRSELSEVKIDLDFQRELFKKASEEKKLLEGEVLELGVELQKEASEKLRLRISRDIYAAEVIDTGEDLAKVHSELREVQIDLNLHRKKARKVK